MELTQFLYNHFNMKSGQDPERALYFRNIEWQNNNQKGTCRKCNEIIYIRSSEKHLATCTGDPYLIQKFSDIRQNFMVNMLNWYDSCFPTCQNEKIATLAMTSFQSKLDSFFTIAGNQIVNQHMGLNQIQDIITVKNNQNFQLREYFQHPMEIYDQNIVNSIINKLTNPSDKVYFKKAMNKIYSTFSIDIKLDQQSGMESIKAKQKKIPTKKKQNKKKEEKISKQSDISERSREKKSSNRYIQISESREQKRSQKLDSSIFKSTVPMINLSQDLSISAPLNINRNASKPPQRSLYGVKKQVIELSAQKYRKGFVLAPSFKNNLTAAQRRFFVKFCQLCSHTILTKTCAPKTKVLYIQCTQCEATYVHDRCFKQSLVRFCNCQQAPLIQRQSLTQYSFQIQEIYQKSRMVSQHIREREYIPQEIIMHQAQMQFIQRVFKKQYNLNLLVDYRHDDEHQIFSIFNGFIFKTEDNNLLSGVTEEQLIIMYNTCSPLFINQFDIDGKGDHNYGVFAFATIQQNQFVCRYSGDILPATHTRKRFGIDYSFALTVGKNCNDQFIINPLYSGGIGILINHTTQQNANLRTVTKIQKGAVSILFIASKKIMAGQQLLYNYNSQTSDYPVEGFIPLTPNTFMFHYQDVLKQRKADELIEGALGEKQNDNELQEQ